MSPQLQRYADAYREAQTRLHAVADGLDDEAFNWKPDAKRWSVGECVVHLNTISKGYLPALEAVVATGAPRADGPFTYNWFTRQFVKAVTPGSRSMRTAPSMKPPPAAGRRSEIDKARAMSRFDRDIDRFVSLVELSDGLDLTRIKMRSPFLRLANMNLGGYLEALGLHAIRHVEQADRVTRLPGFPGGGQHG